MKAVIDRFEGDTAVLLLGKESQIFNIPRAQLPKDAKAGTWLQLDILAGQVTNIKIDEAETEAARQRSAGKLAKLRKGNYK